MRFMMIMYPGPNAEAGIIPDKKIFKEMGKYNEEMVKAGVMLEGEGLHPSSKGARIKFTNGKPEVIEGPFADADNIVGGFWLIQAKSKKEAIEWASKCPVGAGEMIEIRQVYEMNEFPREVFSEEDVRREKALRDQMHQRSQRLH